MALIDNVDNETIIRLTHTTHYSAWYVPLSLYTLHFLYQQAAIKNTTLIAISAPREPKLVLTNTLTIASPKTYRSGTTDGSS